MKRATILILAVTLALAAPTGAFAQSDPFSPLPPAAPEETATPEPVADPEQDDVSRETLFVILGSLLVVFVGIGYLITRDARSALPRDEREKDSQLTEPGPHRKPKQAKAKARKKTREQKRARRANRPSRR